MNFFLQQKKSTRASFLMWLKWFPAIGSKVEAETTAFMLPYLYLCSITAPIQYSLASEATTSFIAGLKSTKDKSDVTIFLIPLNTV